MIRYLVPGLSIGLLAVTGYAVVERQARIAANVKLELAEAQLLTCGGRLRAVLDDVRSDREIDTLPDSALRDVPPEWLRPAPSGD